MDFTHSSDVGTTNINYFPDENDENGNSVIAQPTDKQEDLNEMKIQVATI